MLGRDPLARPEELIPRVYAYVAYRIGSGPDAEDVTSEAFERALRYRSSFDASKGSPISWLIGIAARLITDARRPASVELDEGEEGASDAFEDDAAERLSLHAAVAALEPRDRELIALRYGADLTARQIGELQGVKTNAVEVALHRALARLRASLTADPQDSRSAASL